MLVVRETNLNARIELDFPCFWLLWTILTEDLIRQVRLKEEKGGFYF